MSSQAGALALAASLSLGGCSFEHGKLASDAQIPGDGVALDAQPLTDAQQPTDTQQPDAFVASTNVVAASAGATLVAFTSEYCTPTNTPPLCQSGYWNHTNINDGQYGNGDNSTAYRAAWCSGSKQDASPETFELAFASGRSARIERFVIQNWGRGNGLTLYYATHAIIYTRAVGSSTWTTVVDTALATNETPQTFTLATPVTVDRVRLAITDAQRTDFWELGEFEAWGWLE